MVELYMVQKVAGSNLGSAFWQLENSLCQPTSKWVSFSNQGRVRQVKEGGWTPSSIIMLCLRYSSPVDL